MNGDPNQTHFHQMKYLVQFAQTYLTFRLPEFDSLLELNHLKKEEVYSMWEFVVST